MAKYQITPKKAVVGVDRLRHYICIHVYKRRTKEYLSKILAKLLHAYTQCVSIVKAKY